MATSSVAKTHLSHCTVQLGVHLGIVISCSWFSEMLMLITDKVSACYRFKLWLCVFSSFQIAQRPNCALWNRLLHSDRQLASLKNLLLAKTRSLFLVQDKTFYVAFSHLDDCWFYADIKVGRVKRCTRRLSTMLARELAGFLHIGSVLAPPDTMLTVFGQ